jgi:hypothetical protein
MVLISENLSSMSSVIDISEADGIYATPIIENFDKGRDLHFTQFGLTLHKESGELTGEDAVYMVRGDMFDRIHALCKGYGIVSGSFSDPQRLLHKLPHRKVVTQYPDGAVPHRDFPQTVFKFQIFHPDVTALYCLASYTRRNPTIGMGRTGLLTELIGLSSRGEVNIESNLEEQLFVELVSRYSNQLEYEQWNTSIMIYKLLKNLRQNNPGLVGKIKKKLKNRQGLLSHNWLDNRGKQQLLFVDNSHALHCRGNALTRSPKDDEHGHIRMLTQPE